MIQFVDAHGCLVFAATSRRDVPERFLAAPYAEVIGGRIAEDEFIADGVVRPRPRLALPRSCVAEVGVGLHLTDLPEGAEISVMGGDPLPLPDGRVELVFPVPGQWMVEIRLPRPWLSHDMTVEVRDADPS